MHVGRKPRSTGRILIPMKLAALTFSFCLLSLSALRLRSSIDTTIRRRDETLRMRTLVPNVASLHGVFADGSRFDVDVESDGPVLLFPLHGVRPLAEVTYWNEVADLTSRNLRRLRLIAVCESPEGCARDKAGVAGFDLPGLP